MEISEYLYEKRHGASYSARQFANLVGCSESFITGIERGAQFPSRAMAQKMLDMLLVDYEVLNPFTIRVAEGYTFKFKFSAKGRGSKKSSSTINKSQLDILEYRLSILEAKYAALEKLIRSNDG